MRFTNSDERFHAPEGLEPMSIATPGDEAGYMFLGNTDDLVLLVIAEALDEGVQVTNLEPIVY